MPDVAVLGTGRMGAQVVRALREADLKVAVWNRTASRAKALEERGVRAFTSAADAVRSAPVTLICVLDYAATRDVLARIAPELPDRSVIQTAGGLPDDVDEIAVRVTAAGATYLEAVLLCYPPDLGTPAAHVPYAGPRRCFDDAAHVVQALGGAVYLGEDLRLANAYYAAGCTFYYGVVGGALAAAGIGAATGLGPRLLERALRCNLDSLADTVRDSITRISASSYGVEHTSLNVHREALEQLILQCERSGLDGRFLAALHGQVADAIAEGHDEAHIAVLSEGLAQ